MNSALRLALAALVPSRSESLFLKACLGDGEACAQAWHEFQRHGGNLKETLRTEREELKLLGPLLLSNLTEHGVTIESELQTILRTALFREQLRTTRYQDVLSESLRVLEEGGIEVVLIRGAALSNSVYRDPAFRHSHDIDFLIRAVDRPRAVGGLVARGFAGGPASGDATAGAIDVTHPNGLPLRFHTSIAESFHREDPWTGPWSRSVSAVVAGSRVRLLAPEDSLALALASAAWTPRHDLRWACDAWMVAAASPALSPERVAHGAAANGLVHSTAVLLKFVADLGAPVSPRVLDRVEEAADAASPMDRDLALRGLRRGAGSGLNSVLERIPDFRARAAMIAWVVFPSLEYLRWAYRPRYQALAPAYYVIRILSSLG